MKKKFKMGETKREEKIFRSQIFRSNLGIEKDINGDF